MSVAVRTPAMELVQRVRSDDFQEQIDLVLPPHVTRQTWTRYLITALLTNPALAEGFDQSGFTALIQAAADGLVPDGKQAALVKRGGKVVYTPMIGGLRLRAAEYGWKLRSGVVHEADEFDYADEPPSLAHVRARPGVERGAIAAAYAIAEHPRWGRMQKVMHGPAIDKRRAIATTQKVWNEWEEEMAEKTVEKALIAELPMTELDRLERPQLPPPDVSHAAIYGSPKTPPPGLPAETAAPARGDQSSGGTPEAAGEGPPSSSPSAAPEPFSETLDEIPWPGDEA